MRLYLLLFVILVLIILISFYKNTINSIDYFINMKNMKNKVINNRKNIAIITLETRDSEMLRIHNKNMKEYCDLHGYTYIFINSYENELKLPVYWKKLQFVKEILENYSFDYVFWFDSDTLIIDKDIRLESILDDYSSIYMGHNYDDKLILCSGVFAIKNNIIGLKFIKECIDTYINKDECNDSLGNYTLKGNWAGQCYEQGIMNELIKTRYFNYFKLFQNYIVFNYNIPNTNCFILHLYGEKKVKTNKAFAKIDKNKKYFNSRISQFLFNVFQ